MECPARLPVDEEHARILAAPPTREAQEAVAGELARRALEEAGVDPGGAGRIARLILGEAERLTGSDVSLVAFVVGEWGLGKTHIAGLLVEEAAGRGLRAWRETYDNLLDEARRRMGGSPDVLRAKEAMVERLASKGLPAIVVVDEVESAIRSLRGQGTPQDAAANNAFFELIKALLDPGIEAGRSLRGRLHLVLAMTPEAYRLVEENLHAQGVAGKFGRRINVYFLEPLAKHEMIRVLEAYTRLATGHPAREVFDDPRLLEAYHTISQGNPGAALQLLRRVLQWHRERCGDSCICRVTPGSQLEAMAEATVTDESGRQVDVVANKWLARLLAREAPPGARLLAASTSAVLLEREEASGEDEAFLEGHGLSPVRAWAYRVPGDRVEEWLSIVEERLCPARRAECTRGLRRFAGWLLHLDPRGGYIVAVPRERELREWARRLGWAPERDPGPGDFAYGEDEGEALVLPPSRVWRLYQSRRVGVEFLDDDLARRRALETLEEAQRDPAAYAVLVKKGLLEVLANEGVPGAGEGSYEYIIENLGERVSYKIPVEVDERGLLDPGRVVEECRASPERQARIIILPVAEDARVGAGGCPGIVLLPLQQGLQDSLASLAAGLEAARSLGVPVDSSLVRSLSRSLAEQLDLATGLHEAARRLEEAGLIVKPVSQGLRRAASAPGVPPGDPAEAARHLADTHGYLVAAGGGAGPVDAGRIQALTVLAAGLSPYGRPGQKWCGARVPRVAAGGLKDEPPDMVRRSIDLGLQALLEEGLAEGGEEGYRSRAPRERLASLILRLQGDVDDDALARAFILPASTQYRRMALDRLRVRLAALSHLGLAAPRDREASQGFWTRSYTIGRAQAPRRLPLPPDTTMVRVALDEYGRRTRGTPWEGQAPSLGTLLVYKARGYKVIAPGDLEEARRILEEVDKTTPAGAEFYRDFAEVIGRYAQLMKEAVTEAAGILGEATSLVDAARAQASSILGALERLLGLPGGERIVEAYRGLLDERAARFEDRIVELFTDALRRAERIVANPATAPGDLKEALSYNNCLGRRRVDHHYSPHLYLLRQALSKARQEYEEFAGWVEREKSRIDSFLSTINELGEDGVVVVERAAEILARGGSPGEALRLAAAQASEEVERRRRLREEARRLEDRALEAQAEAERWAARLRGAMDELNRVARHSQAMGDDKTLGDAQRLREEALEAMSLLESASKLAGELVAKARTGGCLEDVGECRRLWEQARGRLDEALRRIPRILDQSTLLWERLVDRAREAIGEAREALERAREIVRVADLPQGRDLALASRLSRIAKALESLDPHRDPAGSYSKAVRAREEIMGIVEEAFTDERERSLFHLVEALRRRPTELRRLLGELARLGYAGEELVEALERMAEMASRLGYQLEVRAERRRGQSA